MPERRATAAATRDFAARFVATAPHGHAPLGTTGLTASRIGFGGYRVDAETPLHRQSLEEALAAGCNLVDTSTNYTDGGSERLAGQVLRDLEGRGRLARDQVIVVSKIGYVQGQNLDLAGERERAGRPFPEMVKYAEGCWHCIHPDFLRDQLQRSLERLQLESLDVCLLHNPEYFLSDAAKHGEGDLEAARAEFYRRAREAFTFFEEAVRQGLLQWYGVSSNTLVSPAGDGEATSASRFLMAAREAGGPGHHFRVLQMPMNLFEPGGALIANTGEEGRATPLEAAVQAGLGVLVNRPLNAFAGQRLLRLADPPVPGESASLPDLLAALSRLGDEYRASIAPHRKGDTLGGVTPDHLFQLVEEVATLPGQVSDASHWQQIEQQYVVPRINYVVRALAQGLEPEMAAAWQSWWARFLPSLQALLREVGRQASLSGREQARTIAAAIDPALPAARRGEPLSRKALWTVASTPGVSCVLVGMRRPEYVRDALGVLAWPPLPDPQAVYRSLQT